MMHNLAFVNPSLANQKLKELVELVDNGKK